MKIEDGINLYLEDVKIRLSEATFKYYSCHLKNLNDFCILKKYENLENLCNEKFYREYVIYQKNSNVKNITINKRIKSLYMVLKYNSMNYNFVKLKEQYKTFDIIPEKNLKDIMNHIYNLEENNFNLNMKLVVMILLETGVRANELINIEKLNIDLNENSILLTTTKTSCDRYVFFKGYTKSLIVKNLELRSKSKFLFYNWNKDKKFNRNCIDYIIVCIKKACNINQLSAHMFRHTFATILIDKGCPLFAVQKLLGHKSIKTTERYVHQSKSKIKEEFIKYFPEYKD